MKSPSRSAASRYQKFHGHAPRRIRTVEIRPLREIICLGKACEIVYASDKENGGGDGRARKFVHKFGKNTRLYTSPEGDLLLIAGKGMRVTSRGIVG